MKTFLFLDDWMLDSYRDVVRRFGRPEPVDVDPVPFMGNYATVLYDPERGCYRAWYNRQIKRGGKKVWVLCLAESPDGYCWEQTRPEVVLSGFTSASGAAVFYDPYDPDPQRRYKAAFSDRVDGRDLGLTACSPDGVHWNIDAEHPFFTRQGGVDTFLKPLFNPFRGWYQISARPSVLDRRVAMVTSPDFVRWGEPQLVLQPDPLDEPCLQFYGMPAFLYEDVFIGLLWCHHTNQEEREWGGCKMAGTIDCELAYSYDGLCWNRADRQPFLGCTEPGTYGCGSIYPHSLVVEKDQIRIYSCGTLVDHSLEEPPEGYESVGALLVHRLRRDGFAYLEPRAGWGQVTMRCVQPRDGKITINFCAPFGEVLAQISDPHGRPIPGYGFEDCVPLTGDKLAAPLRWKERGDASKLIGKHVRLEFRLFQARLYAVRWEAEPWYGDFPIERI